MLHLAGSGKGRSECGGKTVVDGVVDTSLADAFPLECVIAIYVVGASTAQIDGSMSDVRE